MSLDWDILLDEVSVKGQISQFEVRTSSGSYARELTLTAADPAFYDQFEFNALPQLRLEVKIKEDATWISLGKFYIEQPGILADPDGYSGQGLWGRSETAKAGPPFAPKVSKSWDTDTTAQAIMVEMASLVGLSLNFQMADYTVFAGSYVVDGAYPIQVITELAEFAGGTVGCTADGAMEVRSDLFHPGAADHIVTDLNIADMTESVEYPEFGNRVRISADGTDSGYSVNVEAQDDSDCLPADGESTGTLLAFVTKMDQPADDNTLVQWTAGDGVTLEQEYTPTGDLLLSNKVHRADNYNKVTVDYPVSGVIGVWAYSDLQHQNNFWDESKSGCTFEDNTISVHNPFSFCDQTLVITYLTSGCAVNTVTAGLSAMDVTVTADVGGVQGNIDIKLGNTCACGSSLSIRKNNESTICIGDDIDILVWGELYNNPATGMIATLSLTGCGELSSTKKIFGTISVSNEIGYVSNNIQGVSQVACSIFPDSSSSPAVYETTDTSKSNNLYSSHTGKTIDLDTVLDTGTEVWIDYSASGAAAVSWKTDDADDESDCDAEVTVSMANGTEAGLSGTITLSASDCSESDTDPDSSEYYSDDDPDGFDYDGYSDDDEEDEEGADSDSGGAALNSCDAMILNRSANIDNAVGEEKDKWRFGVGTSFDCQQCAPEDYSEDDYGCPCSDLCESEVSTKGNTYDYNKTIHETAIETYEDGTPEYYEEYERVKQESLAECEQKCEEARQGACSQIGIIKLEPDTDINPETIAPSSSAIISFTGGDNAISASISGTGFWLDSEFSLISIQSEISQFAIYTDETACGPGVLTVSDKCTTASYSIRCTDGEWVLYSEDNNLCTAAGGDLQVDGDDFILTANTEKMTGTKYHYPALDGWFGCGSTGCGCNSCAEVEPICSAGPKACDLFEHFVCNDDGCPEESSRSWDCYALLDRKHYRWECP